MPLLVTGATGRTSAGVVRHLRSAGEHVRVLVRDADKAGKTFEDQDGVEIVAGAFDDETVLARAFDGVDVAFLALGSSPDQIRLENAMIDGAVTAELPHLVKLSSIATSHDSALLVGRLHAEIEDHLVASGLAYTLLRPASYSNNLFYAAKSVAMENSWSGAAPTGRVAYIDIRDLSEAAALVLRDPALHGKTYHLSARLYLAPQPFGIGSANPRQARRSHPRGGDPARSCGRSWSVKPLECVCAVCTVQETTIPTSSRRGALAAYLFQS
jgi:uncharacterized protein YbjT (DUF2867 family)